MASETALSESAVNKSVDEEVEGSLLEKTMDDVDVLKVVGDSTVTKAKEKLEEAEIPEFKENENPKEQTLVNEGLNEEKVVDEADVSKTVDDFPVLDCKDTEIFKEDKTPAGRENEIPKEQAIVNEGINIEEARDDAEVSIPVDISSISDSKVKDILKEEEIIEVKDIEHSKEQQIVKSATNENLEIPKIPEVEETSPPKDEETEISMKEDSMKAQDTQIFKEDKTPTVMENEIPKEQATVNEGINIEKAQDEAEASRPADISSISDSKDKDILKEEERIEVEEIKPPKEQQIVESATNENLEIPRTPEVEETNPPKDEETEISMKEDSMKVQESNAPKEVEGNKGATESSSKEAEMPVVPGDSSSKKQDTLEATEKENLKEEETYLEEKEKSHEQEINKDQAITEKGNEEPLKVVEEDKLKNEAFESAEVDRENKATVAESREVQIPVVTGAESKIEDVPAVVVKKVVEKPAARRSDIFRNVGSKMMHMVQKMRNAITRKSSNAKVPK